MDNDATTWQACKLCIKTATSELISAMSISSESKNRVKSTAAAPMSAHMAKVRTLVEVQPSIQSVAHCAASVPFMAAILFSVSAAASRWRMKRPKGLLKEQKRCLAAANVWPLENLLPETESANQAEYVVLFQIFWHTEFFPSTVSSIKVLIAVSAFHGCRSNLWQAWALSLPIIFVLGIKVSSAPRRPLPNSWASISAAAQSVTVISTRSCKCCNNFDSNFRVRPRKFRGASCLGVASMLTAFSIASTMSLAVKHPTHNRHVLQSGSEPDQHLAMPFVPDQHHHGSTCQQAGAVMIQHRFAQTPSHQSFFIWTSRPVSATGTFP